MRDVIQSIGPGERSDLIGQIPLCCRLRRATGIEPSNAAAGTAANAGRLAGSLRLIEDSRNVEFSDLDCCRALGDEEGQELERIFGAGGGDEPPDRVAAEEA